jgi:hypothetical protein
MGHKVDAICEDAFGIALRPDGTLSRAFGGKLSEIRIDGHIVYSHEAEDTYLEMSGGRIYIVTGTDRVE